MDENYWNERVALLRYKKNVILQGAPGTGKTYAVAELAVRLCCDLQGNPGRDTVMDEYKRLTESGRVVLTTFHPSMDYEELVEGLKPEVVDGVLQYTVTDGLFKQINRKALLPVVENVDLGIRENPVIWKVSLQGTGSNPVRTDCLENNRIRIGWDGYGPSVGDGTNYEHGGRIVLDAFINRMQPGDIVMSCYTHRIVDAIGVVTGDYEWLDDVDDFCRSRSVNWLVKNIREDIFELNNRTTLTLSTVYRLNNISLENVMELLKKYNVVGAGNVRKNEKPYVLVIDEINRGNVSKILGELVTLLEPDKRTGEANQLQVTLPYSQEVFGVAPNLYIIGTMNTADRSIGSIDYAVRRRFAFMELTPGELPAAGFDAALFREVAGLFICNYPEYIEGAPAKPSVYLSDEFRPGDVMLGHSYFIMQDRDGRDVTRFRVKYEIVPILKEYLQDGIFKDPDAVKVKIEALELTYSA